MPRPEFPFGTMTVGQIRQALEKYGDEMPVVIAYSYGDYARTQAVRAIDGFERVPLSETG